MKKVLKIVALLLIVALLAIPAAAAALEGAGFTPSVTQKDSPDVVEVPDASGAPAAAIVYDENQEEVAGIAATGIKITPVSDVLNEEPVSEAAEEELTAAYNSIYETESLAAAAPQLVEALTEMDTELTTDDLVVRDIFHVALDQETIASLPAAKAIALTFDLGVEEDTFLIAMRYVDGEWVPVDPELVIINEDGSVTVMLEMIDGKVGTIAFVTQVVAE